MRLERREVHLQKHPIRIGTERSYCVHGSLGFSVSQRICCGRPKPPILGLSAEVLADTKALDLRREPDRVDERIRPGLLLGQDDRPVEAE